MTRRLVSGVVVGALAAAFAGSLAAQPKADPKGYVPGTAGCDPNNCGYVLSATGTPDNNVIKSGVYNGALGLAGNLCYRTGYWTPQMAIESSAKQSAGTSVTKSSRKASSSKENQVP